MRSSLFFSAVAPVLLLAALPARGAPAAGAGSTAMPGGMAGPVPTQPADREMMAGMDAMSRDMGRAPMTGDPDRDFAAMMLPHHRGAVAMARTELRYGRDPAMRALAARIVADQDREIALMRRWLAARPPG